MFKLLKLLIFSGPDCFLSPLNESDKTRQTESQAWTHIDNNGNAFINIEDEEFKRFFASHIHSVSWF